MPVNDEFYVGYQPQAPRMIGRGIRNVAIALSTLGGVLATILAFSQAPFAKATFEFGVTHTYEGELVEWPVPMLLTADSRYLLVLPGKHGAAKLVHGLDRFRLRVDGTLIERGTDRMLEIVPDSLRPITQTRTPPQPHADLGEVRLTGEIVDSKCFLGVMNPGQGKVHRDCAVRCISGGVPPAFLVRDATGEGRVVLLTGPDGRAIGRDVLSMVAEPVTIHGHLMRINGALVIEAESSAIRRE